MALLDEQVKGWLKDKFLKSSDYYPLTMGEPEEVTVISADAGWECMCYSEYTRDDEFEFRAVIQKGDGSTFGWTYGAWGYDLPKFIEELDEYINGNECYYESDDFPWS